MNAPKLRFKEFNDEWITYKFYDLVSIINGQVDPNKKEYCNLPHIGPGNIEKETGRLLEYNLAKDDKLISSKYLFNEKSVIYGKINPHFAKVCYPKFVGLCSADSYPINPIEEKLTSTFLLYLLLNPKFTKFATSVSMRTGMPKINRDELGIYKFTIPKINEQIKIGDFLSLLDKKIELQSKKIEDLKLFKKGLYSCLKKHVSEYKTIKLGNLCNITTGKLDANAMKENGKYRFYTCAEEYYYIDEYAFDTEALLISGNGANVGYIHYYKGKFNAYQRTYVLDKFSENINYIKIFLDNNLKARISSEVRAGNTPYITLPTLSEMKIQIPIRNDDIKQFDSINLINNKIHLNISKLSKLQELKK